MTKPTRLSTFYEIAMASLAIVIVIIFFIELTTPLTESQEVLLTYIDFSVLIIFVVDYIYRFIRAENKWTFFRSNIFDLSAIIPFDRAFRIGCLVRLGRLIRLTTTG
jgi:voltage-gated potassium channel